MKKIIIAVLLITGFATYAQSLDVHYDFERECITTTVEMFKPDKLGNTFFFIDMNYGEGDVKGVTAAYWEIARTFNLGKTPFGVNLEYNGGFLRKNVPVFVKDDEGNLLKKIEVVKGLRINDAFLLGPTYSKNAKDFSKGFTVKALYKYIDGLDDAHNFQLTGVWYIHFLKDRKMTFKGFFDFWKQKTTYFDRFPETGFIMLTEPQLWYNINKTFSVGTEVEFSNNFGVEYGFKTRPTLVAKWKF